MTTVPTPPRARSGFKIAIICAVKVEAESVRAIFDKCWEDEGKSYGKAAGDKNTYTTGVIGRYNVVLVLLPSMGSVSAAQAAASLGSSYPKIELVLVVGVCGVVPVNPDTEEEIVLGDVIVSTAATQYDFGRTYPGGFLRKTSNQDSLRKTPKEIQGFMNKLDMRQNRQKLRADLIHLVSSTQFQQSEPTAVYPGAVRDYLYDASYLHQHRPPVRCDVCYDDLDAICSLHCDKLGCGTEKLVTRRRLRHDETHRPGVHPDGGPLIHLGRIGSANAVMTSGINRDILADKEKLIAFEMEGAGVWDEHQTIVIKGACDYADSHKHKAWQPYAAMMAAGCLKVVLDKWVVSDELADNDAPRALGLATGTAHEYWFVPRSAQPLFTGRKELLQDLERVVRDSPCRIVLSGLGGQGKSEVALQLAHRLRHIFWAVVWVDVSTTGRAERSFVDAAQMLSFPVTTGKAACLRIANLKVKWLLILDNADATEVDYLDYFPDSNFGSIVMTTRNKECERYGTDRVVNLAGLDNRDAIELLLKACRITPDRYELYQQDAYNVVNLLGSHTLALLLAGAYVARGHSTLANYPQAYRANRQRLMSIRPQQAKSHGQDVYSTFELSANALRSMQDQRAQDALQLLHLLAVCGPNSLPIRMLCEIAWQSSKQVREDFDRVGDLTPLLVANLPSFIDQADDSDMSFRLMEATSLLEEYSLVSTSTGDNSSFVSLHPLVHAWAWDRQGREEQHRSWLQIGCLVTLTLWSQDLTYYNKTALLTHVEALIDWPVSTMFGTTTSLCTAQILYRCYWYLREMLVLNRVSMLTRKISEGLHLDGTEIDQAHLKYHELIAWGLHSRGQFEESAGLWEQIVQFREESCPEDYEGLLTSQHNLAAELGLSGRKEDAINLLDKIVKSSSGLLPENHPSRLKSRESLAWATVYSGQTEKALVLLEKLIDDLKTLPRDHPQRLSAKNLLAKVYRSLGRLEEAIALLEELVAIGHTKLAEDNPDFLGWQASLAECLWESGQQGRAVDMLRELRSAASGVIEENHPTRQYFEKKFVEWEATMAKSV